MKTVLLAIVSLGLIAFTSCSKEAMYETDYTPIAEITNENNEELATENADATLHTGENLTTENATTTVQLQALRTSTNSTNTIYTVTYDDNITISSQETLKDTQTITGTDLNGNPTSLTLDVIDFQFVGDTFEVNYESTGSNTNGITINTTQIVIVEDIIVN